MSISLEVPKCPKCGAYPGRIEETLLVSAGIARQDDGSFEYTDDSDIDWNSQEISLDYRGDAFLTCSACGETWASGLALE